MSTNTKDQSKDQTHNKVASKVDDQKKKDAEMKEHKSAAQEKAKAKSTN